MMSMSSLITLHAAAAILNLKPQTLRARITRGAPLKLARRHPLQRVKLQDVLQYRESMPPVLVKSGRPRLDAAQILREIFS